MKSPQSPQASIIARYMYILGLFNFFFNASYAFRAEIKSLLLPNSDMILQNKTCACGRRDAYLKDVIPSYKS